MSRRQLVVYVHGQGGHPTECEHYRPLFPHHDVIGLDYRTSTPWETGAEIHKAICSYRAACDHLILIANSIGAFFCMYAAISPLVKRAYFISPVVDMVSIILRMMEQANITEEALQAHGTLLTPSGEKLSWKYLCYVREHPISWSAPTKILYGAKDNLTPLPTMTTFAQQHHAALTIMEDGEHWFHTTEQMRFLDEWIRSS